MTYSTLVGLGVSFCTRGGEQQRGDCCDSMCWYNHIYSEVKGWISGRHAAEVKLRAAIEALLEESTEFSDPRLGQAWENYDKLYPLNRWKTIYRHAPGRTGGECGPYNVWGRKYKGIENTQALAPLLQAHGMNVDEFEAAALQIIGGAPGNRGLERHGDQVFARGKSSTNPCAGELRTSQIPSEWLQSFLELFAPELRPVLRERTFRAIRERTKAAAPAPATASAYTPAPAPEGWSSGKKTAVVSVVVLALGALGWVGYRTYVQKKRKRL